MLFLSTDIRRSQDEAPGHDQPEAVHAEGPVRLAIGRKRTDLQQLIGTLSPNEHIHIPSMGNWSMHHMLQHILEQTGPADVWLTSWTITEEPVRMLLSWMDTGLIRTLKALLSERVEAMNPAAHQLARFNLQVKLTKIHAKSIVVLNDEWGVTVGGSANFTRNPRIEKYIVSTHRAVAEFERTWIEQVMAGADPFAAHD